MRLPCRSLESWQVISKGNDWCHTIVTITTEVSIPPPSDCFEAGASRNDEQGGSFLLFAKREKTLRKSR
jgi:hypothetical protein